MIEVKHIQKSFDDKIVLKGININFKEGETNLIIGSSGTGKSVLLKILVGLLHPDSGDVFFDNKPFYSSSRNIKKEIRRQIGMMFQGAALFDSMTVEENVKFPLNILTKKTKEEKIYHVNKALKRVGLENVNSKMPSEISGGMKKRVGIARAIVNEPSYAFFDEPNSGLDPLTATKIDNLIYEITCETKMTSIIVSHDMNSVIEIGDHVIFLSDGEKVWEGTNSNILHSDNKILNQFVFSNKLMKTLRK